jgi:hypothetical protein
MQSLLAPSNIHQPGAAITLSSVIGRSRTRMPVALDGIGDGRSDTSDADLADPARANRRLGAKLWAIWSNPCRVTVSDRPLGDTVD